MSYFDNANNQVTRKSFGSKVDKEFKREGVIPIKDRKKDNGPDLVAEAAKQQELDKNVRERRLNELKNRKAYDVAMQEGYSNLKNELIKDIIGTICIESLLVDDDVVNENYGNIVEMINNQIDDMGGFLGIKHIAETFKNPVLMNMISVCEDTCKKVGERNMKESKGLADNLDFNLNRLEMDKYDYKKREIGIDSIVKNIKDKVFQVVQDEQKLNNDRQMIMSDIQDKVSELDVPAEEAMQFIFESVGIEEETLFGSMMRSHYKQIIESNSSPIFESFDYKDEEESSFEDSEFEMSDLSMVDMDEEDKREIEDVFINECKKLINVEDDEYESALESLYKLLLEGSENIIVKNQAEHYKSIVRKVQEGLEYVEEKYIKNIQKHARKISNKKLDKSIVKWEEDIEKTRTKIKNEKDPVCLDDYKEDLRILTAELKALKAEKSHRGKQLKTAKEANPYMKSTMESVEDAKQRLLNTVEETDSPDKAVDDSTLEKDMTAGDEVTEEIILCPTCGKEECTCKVAKESNEVVTEGKISDMITNYFSKSLSKKISKRDFGPVRERLTVMIENCMTMEHIKALESDIEIGITQLKKAKADYPESTEKIDEHIKWLNTVAKEQLRQRANKIKKGMPLSETVDLIDYYTDKLEGICETMNRIVDAHEDAVNVVTESLTREIKGVTTLVPYLQTNDVNLNNLQFAYKTKIVCESLKNNLYTIKTKNDADILKRAVELNVESINETLDLIDGKENFDHKAKLLKKGKVYLNKILENLDYNSSEYSDEINESYVFSTPEDIEEAFNYVREYAEIESTNNDVMEVVMAEVIVEYTILETLNTLNLVRYTKDSVRQMARKNISVVSEGFGKK